MVSVIMPAYNCARYLAEAVRSVQAQTYTDWELLIIDDASSDKTAEIAQLFALQDPRILYFKNDNNQGPAGTRNRGVSLSRGEWIAFLDSDDAWAPDKLKRQLALAGRTGASFLFCGSAFMDENSARLHYCLKVPERVTYRQLLKQNIISCSSVLIKADLIRAYPMKHALRLHEDFAVWLQILRDRNLVAWAVTEPLLIYRISASSKSGNKIKSGLMTYRVYRYLGLSFFTSMYYFCFYFIRSLRKYSHLG